MEVAFISGIAVIIVLGLLFWSAEGEQRDPSDTGDFGDIA